jgi:hypothetical protein
MAMKCERCGITTLPGEERELHGMRVCEDCYMDLLSPARLCDPWSAMTAKSVSQLAGSEESVTQSQQRILEVLQQGPIALEDLAGKTNLEISELKRDLAALHHMEKVGGSLVNGRQVFQLWSQEEGNNHDGI